MTDLALSPTDVDVTALGQAIAGGLAAVPDLAVEPVGADDPVPLPGEPTGVGVDLGDGVRLVLVLSKAAARQVQVGPPPAEDVVDGCAAALAAGAAAIGATPAGEPAEVPAAQAVPGNGEVAVAAKLLSGADHVATVALVALAPPPPPVEDAPVHEFAPLPGNPTPIGATGLELLHDVSLGVTAELGRTRMTVRDVLSLAPGSVIELDRAAGSPVDVLVNGTLIAKGEVVVIDEEFGIRITEVIGYSEGNGR